MMKLRSWLTSLSLVLVCGTTQADTGIDKYIKIFTNGTSMQQRSAVKEFPYTGLSDPKLFDLVEQRLIEIYPTATSKNEMETASWLAKGLAYSGQEKYRATLQQIATEAKSSKVRKYAAKALIDLDRFIAWNPVINDTSTENPEISERYNQYANMLRSNIYELKRVGAKKVFYERITNEYLIDIVQQQIEENYQVITKDKLQIDTLSWLCKGLAATTLPQYISTVRRQTNGTDEHLI